MKFILASKSPRRREILSNVGMEFDIVVSNSEENCEDSLSPEEFVMELSRQKASAVAGQTSYTEDFLIIGSDTVVVFEGEIMGKPKDKEDAERMLSLLSGKSHSVFTGVTLLGVADGKEINHSFYEETIVHFNEMNKEDIDWYIGTGDPFDKAGAYGIQGPCSAFIKGIEGDYFTVMGFPVARLCKELKILGINRR